MLVWHQQKSDGRPDERLSFSDVEGQADYLARKKQLCPIRSYILTSAEEEVLSYPYTNKLAMGFQKKWDTKNITVPKLPQDKLEHRI